MKRNCWIGWLMRLTLERLQAIEEIAACKGGGLRDIQPQSTT